MHWIGMKPSYPPYRFRGEESTERTHQIGVYDIALQAKFVKYLFTEFIEHGWSIEIKAFI